MIWSKTRLYALGLIGIGFAGGAFAGKPETPAASAPLPPVAGCTDSPRGRTHVLRMCGAQAHWIKVSRERPSGGGPPSSYLYVVSVPTVSIDMNRY